jgi:hypothetical protein
LRRLLRRIFGPKSDEVTRSWRKLCNEELHNLYLSQNFIRRLGWLEHVTCMGEMRNVYRILVGKPEGMIPLERHGHRQEDNIKIYIKEIGSEGVNWIHLAENRNPWWALLNTVMSGRFHKRQGITSLAE